MKKSKGGREIGGSQVPSHTKQDAGHVNGNLLYFIFYNNNNNFVDKVGSADPCNM